MRPRPVLVAVVLVLVSFLGACGGGGGKGGGSTKVPTRPGPAPTGSAPVTLKAALSGADEVPGPGVTVGVGNFAIDIAGTKGCYTLNATMGEKPTQGHIHQGMKGASGPVVVDLKPTFLSGEASFVARSCVDLPGDTAAKLIANPSGYYVNVHSDDHPNGAMRGQLARF
jgi:hypothetical protein